MPIPTCEITSLAFEPEGELAPHVLPCSHVFSLAGIYELFMDSLGGEAACPRCKKAIKRSLISRLPRHKKLCTLVHLLTRYRVEPSRLFVSSDTLATTSNGCELYQGTLKTGDSVRSVTVKAVAIDGHEGRASNTWRELVLLQQLTESLGDQVVRVLGYVEQPSVSLQIILEGSRKSVGKLLEHRKMSFACTMRMARHVINTILALHNMHIVHADVCPYNVHCWEGRSAARYKLSGFSNAHAWVPPHTEIPVAILQDLPQAARPYAAPERWDDKASITDRSDVWAFGVTVWHCLTGKLPHRMKHRQVVREDGRRPGSSTSGIPTAVLRLLEECMAPIPAARPSAQKVADRWARLEEQRQPDTKEPATGNSNSKDPSTGGAGAKGLNFMSVRDSLLALVCIVRRNRLVESYTTNHAFSRHSASTGHSSISSYTYSSPQRQPRTDMHRHTSSMQTHTGHSPRRESGRAATCDIERPQPSELWMPLRQTAEPQDEQPRLLPPGRWHPDLEHAKTYPQPLSAKSPSSACSGPPWDAGLLSGATSARSEDPVARWVGEDAAKAGKHPLTVAQQAQAVLVRLGFPKLAVEEAQAQSAGDDIESSLDWLLTKGDVLESCKKNIAKEFELLQAAATERGPQYRTVTTEDVWLWVAQQSNTATFADALVNDVLSAAGVDDEVDVNIEQFTHVVVHMFQAFFARLDVRGTGYLTQADMRAEFFDPENAEATVQLRQAMEQLDVDHDGGISLNELICFGLAGYHSQTNSGSVEDGGSFTTRTTQGDNESEQLREIAGELTGQLTRYGRVRPISSSPCPDAGSSVDDTVDDAIVGPSL